MAKVEDIISVASYINVLAIRDALAKQADSESKDGDK
jgi:hypothetical protein